MNAPQVFSQTPRRFPITADMFERMFEAGIFTSQQRLELRNGELVEVSPAHMKHGDASAVLAAEIRAGLKSIKLPLRTLSETSVRTDPQNVPQPDIVVWDPVVDDGFVPQGATRLPVEISDASLSEDLGPKAALYTSAGIPEYWIADVRARTIRVHSAPMHGAYSKASSIRFGESLVSVTIPGLTVDTSDL